MGGILQQSSVQSITARGPKSMGRWKRDEVNMHYLGKKQVLKRRFGVISTLGLSTTLMLTWEGVLVYFGFGLENGGSAGLVTSFVLSWVCFLATMAPLAELASMAPTSSGQYHWAYMLAPKSSRKLLSYLTGWLSVAVWQSIVAMGGILCATLIEDLLVLTYPDNYTVQGWHGTLLIWATVASALFVNSVLGVWLPQIEGFILYLHVLGFFAIIIPLLHLADRVEAVDVFTRWNNDGGWPNMGVAFLVGIVTNIGPFIGADGAVHLAEETQNASVVIPWNIMVTILVNGLFGFGMLIAALFCMGDLQSAMQSGLNYPFVAIFFTSTKQSASGTCLMVSIVLVLSFFATFGQFAGASRQLWAFARDKGPPFSGWLVLVNPRSYLPLNAIWTTCLVSILLGLINIGSDKALHSVLSFTVSSWEAASAIPLALLLWNRLTGRIQPYDEDKVVAGATGTWWVVDDDNAASSAQLPLIWGPWRIPEPLGTIVNIIGLCWISIAFFFSFWPNAAQVLPKSMNWSVLMTGFWFLFGLVYYWAHGRKYYHGPIIERPDNLQRVAGLAYM
ncbi:Amino acid/polyamine transporter I [Rhypophila decipiens]